MKRTITLILVAIALIGFIFLGLTNIDHTNQKLKTQDIQLKSKQSDLLELETKFDLLNKELEQKNIDAEKAKQLEQEKQDLQKQLQDAHRALEAKAKQRDAERLKVAQTASKVASTPKASAASGCSTGNPAKDFIYQKESGCRTDAINKSSGACGLGQALPCSKLPCSLQDYACQDAWFTNYAMKRYGGWEAAKAFWVANQWW